MRQEVLNERATAYRIRKQEVNPVKVILAFNAMGHGDAVILWQTGKARL
jgi:hypothetical protein